MNDIDGRVADSLKRVSEHHLDETPLGPRGAQRVVVERVRRRWRIFLVVNGLVAVLVVTFAVLMVPRLMSDGGVDPGPRGDTVGQPVPSVTTIPDDRKPAPEIDIQMSELLGAVRPACRSFDFQTMESIRGRRYRPAYCKNSKKQTVLVFSFATEGDRRTWTRKGRRTRFSLPEEKSIVTGDTWEMHFTNPGLAQEVSDELEGRVVRDTN